MLEDGNTKYVWNWKCFSWCSHWNTETLKSVFCLSECTKCFSEAEFSLADSLHFHVKPSKVNSVHLES